MNAKQLVNALYNGAHKATCFDGAQQAQFTEFYKALWGYFDKIEKDDLAKEAAKKAKKADKKKEQEEVVETLEVLDDE